MKTSFSKFVYGAAIGVALLSATTASAGGFKFGSGNSGNKSSGNNGASHFKINSNSQFKSSNSNGNGNSAFRLQQFRKLGVSKSNLSNSSNNSSSNSGSSKKFFDKTKKNNNGLGIILGNQNVSGFPNQLKKFDKFNSIGKLKKHDHCDYDPHCHDHHCHHRVRIYCVQPIDNCYYPYFSSCSVYPGDTYNTLSLRAYGMSSFGRQIANYNRLGLGNTTLIPGQTLQFPVIHPDGRLTKSNAPAHVPFTTPSNYLGANNTRLGAATTQLGTPKSPTTPTSATNDASIPNIAVGSALLIEGQAFGAEKGTAKLRFGGLALPVEVVEWTATAAKVQLPKLDVTTPTTADLELTLANGTLASKSTVRLTPAATQLALRK